METLLLINHLGKITYIKAVTICNSFYFLCKMYIKIINPLDKFKNLCYTIYENR